MKSLISFLIITFILLIFFSYYVTTTEGKENSFRSWDCYCTISLTGTSYSFTPPSWSMSGNALVDREKKTKEYIQDHWLNNRAIWKSLGLNNADIISWCQKGVAKFWVVYGFDPRKKTWSFGQDVINKCKCTGSMIFK